MAEWPGIETEQVINAIDNQTPFHTVLQSDKARLLKEAQAKDPMRLDLWQILLASSKPSSSRSTSLSLAMGRWTMPVTGAAPERSLYRL